MMGPKLGSTTEGEMCGESREKRWLKRAKQTNVASNDNEPMAQSFALAA
jgi:hypothetical protein